MTKLSVNINKIATLRNSRGKNHPDVLQTALDVVAFGAHGITVHPRPDGRHIRKEDVYELARHLEVEFNIEGYPTRDFLDLVKEVKPAQCTLVPDPPHALTSNAGWRVAENGGFLQEIVSELKESGIRVSLFIDPQKISEQEILLLKEINTCRVELYTEAYADAFGTDKASVTLSAYQRVALAVKEVGIGLNAGHDLNLLNLPPFLKAIPGILEVSIGHALVCDALQYGLRATVEKYLNCFN